jgi:RNA polymerase sigma-70 factor (ECF subfamily)
MVDNNPFHDLIERIRKGDESAAAELVRTYEPAIRRAARIRMLDPRLRRVFDSMDISQSVFASFFARAALGQYELNKPQQLVRLLVDMSRKKLADHVRAERADRRDYRRVRQQGSSEILTARDNPAKEAASKELLQEFRNRLSRRDRELADQRALGRNWHEIAADQGESSEALRKRFSRSLDRIAEELGLD